MIELHPIDRERAKLAQTMPDLIKYFEEHPNERTPLAQRWMDLCIEHGQMVYQARPRGASVGRKVRYGTPAETVVCIESAAKFGDPTLWFVKAVV